MNLELIAELNMKCLLLAHEYNGNRSMEELLCRAKALADFLSTNYMIKAI